ncbi:MAG: hypothetical protein D6758_06865, partial [Gammaproteobacteria bacterium]
MNQNTTLITQRPQSINCSAFMLSALLAVGVLALSGCRTDADIQKDVDALVRKTLDNMVFVEGGSFMMGDFRDPESGLYHTWGADSKPA